MLSAVGETFTLSVTNTNHEIVIEEQAHYQNNAYEAKVDTTPLKQGNYTCTFAAYPYGTITSQLTVKQAVKPQSPRIPGFLPQEVAIDVVVAIIILARTLVEIQADYHVVTSM
jgi:hypothetical protein